MTNYAIITAGGIGKRMKAKANKVFLQLLGKEIILHTIEVFEKTKQVDKIVLVITKQDIEEAKKLIEREGFKKVEAVIAGGKERQDSVWNGLQKVKELGAKKGDTVSVHNGANPLIEMEAIAECIKETGIIGAAVAAFPTKDTIKRVGQDLTVKETLDRSDLWAMQTPQTIEFSLAEKAFSKAFKEGFYGTDDVQLVERIKGKVKIVKCSTENIKITTLDDLELAERILEKRIAFHDIE